ncbi:MAG: hypothetical protein RRX92_05475 [Lachnospiraceae bacterium]
MIAKQFNKDNIIFKKNTPIQHIGLISKGSVTAILPNGELTLGSGDVIGLGDLCFKVYSSSYVALEQAVIILYPCTSIDDLIDIIQDNHDVSVLLINSLLKQICEILEANVLVTFSSESLYQSVTDCYDDYQYLCEQYAQPVKPLDGLSVLSPPSSDTTEIDWKTSYYNNMYHLKQSVKIALFQENPDICVGFLCQIGQDMHRIFDTCEQISTYNQALSTLLFHPDGDDLLTLLTDLHLAARKTKDRCMDIEDTIEGLRFQIEDIPSLKKADYDTRIQQYEQCLCQNTTEENEWATIDVDEDIAMSDTEDKTDTDFESSAEIISLPEDSLRIILDYSDCKEETKCAFYDAIAAFRRIEDKNTDDDTTVKLRRTITALFYELYSNVFLHSLQDTAIPTVIWMFLNFGYVDDVLSGAENAQYLYSIADRYHGDAAHGIYTFYEWLLMIYHLEKEPSRNEFDIDYTAYVHDLKVKKQISPAMEQQLLNDGSKRLAYELENLFPVVNKVTFGRITTFCPVLCEQNILKPLQTILAKPSVIVKALDAIRAMDYSAYYHEIGYTNEACNIAHEYLHVEILPNIILMPNVGIRGVMWQEIEGRKRNTPARMMLSALAMTDIKTLLIQLTAAYRWEMCKRVQGGRWNDVSDPSLTSLYCDYAQFYRKNNDLSPQAKEQIKSSLAKAKNNFKELFIRDYIVWVLYEGNGSPRLNKVVRSILLTYCTFPANIRKTLSMNPLFTDLIARYEIKKKQRITRLGNVMKKMQASGISIPKELADEKTFLEQ